MSDYVPAEIITEILLKLPVKSLIRFTTVCKFWCSLITSPKFNSTYISISKNSENPNKTTLLVRHYSIHSKHEVYTLFKLTGNEPTNVLSRTELYFPFKSLIGYFRIVGSLDGLVCVSDDLFSNPLKPIILWNSVVRNYVKLPEALCDPKEPHFFVLGFGSVGDDYKVVRLVYGRKYESFYSSGFLGVEIYSLNLGKWRVLGGDANVRLRVCEFVWSQVFLNGFVHWLAYEGDDYGAFRCSILAFDLANEVFSELTLPVELMRHSVMNLTISVIGKSLGVIKYDKELGSDLCDVWMMNDYSSNKSWTKLYSIDEFSKVIEKVVSFCENGEAVVALRGNQMALCEPKNKVFNSLGVHGTTRSFYAENYVESMLLFRVPSSIAIEDKFKLNEELELCSMHSNDGT